MRDGEERCQKYPSMLKSECSHCQGLEHGTADNPRFSLREFDYEGYPMVEVLKNGGSVGWWDEHFQFGQRKAEMFVACIEILRKFWLSTDEERRAFAPQVVDNKKFGLQVQVYVKMHPDFERSPGQTIDRSWLHLQALSPHNEHIGLGAMKCRAICALENDLNEWLLRQQPQRWEDLVNELRRIAAEASSRKVPTPAEPENPTNLESEAPPNGNLSKEELLRRIEELQKKLEQGVAGHLRRT